MTILKNSIFGKTRNCDKTQKLKMGQSSNLWQYWNTRMVTKLKNSNCDNSKSRNVHMCVCLSVHFWGTVERSFFPPLPEVSCPNFLEIRNPWGKVMKRSVLIFEEKKNGSGLKLPNKNIYILFFAYFCLTKHDGNNAFQWIRDLWSKGVSPILAYF